MPCTAFGMCWAKSLVPSLRLSHKHCCLHAAMLWCTHQLSCSMAFFCHKKPAGDNDFFDDDTSKEEENISKHGAKHIGFKASVLGSCKLRVYAGSRSLNF